MPNAEFPHCSFDETLNMMTLDVANTSLSTKADVDRIFVEINGFLDKLGRKPYYLVNISNMRVSPEAAPYYGEEVQKVLPRVLGLYRYGKLNALDKLTVTTQAVVHQYKVNLFTTREEALAAIEEDAAQNR